MSGRFEYNMTTEIQYEEMKQRNLQLSEENYILKSSIEELIQINSELTDSMDDFNNQTIIEREIRKTTQEEIKSLKREIQMLNEKLNEYEEIKFRQESEKVLEVLEELCDSLKKNHQAYECEINILLNDIELVQKEWEVRLEKMEENYLTKLLAVQDLITHLRKKQQIIYEIERKLTKSKINSMESIPKNPQKAIETKFAYSIERTDSYEIKENTVLNSREKELEEEIEEKNRIIAHYSSLLIKLRKKLIEKD